MKFCEKHQQRYLDDGVCAHCYTEHRRKPKSVFEVVQVQMPAPGRDPIVWIVDQAVAHEAMSVTNDAEAVCSALHAQWPNHRIIYLDTDDHWDELVHAAGVFKRFAPARSMFPFGHAEVVAVYRDDPHRIEVNGIMTAPSFSSREEAEAYANLINRGQRRPEFRKALAGERIKPSAFSKSQLTNIAAQRKEEQ